MKSRGETKASFANRTGVTRATLYKILEGKVNSVQQSTVTRIADFFGVSCDIIENRNLEHIELIEKTLSPEGDKNPAAIPVIPQSELMFCFEHRIGHLVTQYPVTWYFGEVSNMIGLRIEENMNNTFFPGDILVIRRKSTPENSQIALYHSQEKGIYFKQNNASVSHLTHPNETLLGTVFEERILSQHI